MSKKLLFDYHDALVYEEDARLFKAPGWLNDICINFYYRVLEHEDFQDRPDILFMDPAVVSCMLIQCTDQEELEELGQGLALDTRSLVFIPINDAEAFFSGNSHWSLLVYYPGSKTGIKFFHFDSSQGRNEPAATSTASKFCAMLGEEGGPMEMVSACPQQENGFDCGMYVLCITRYLAHLFVTQMGSSSSSNQEKGKDDEEGKTKGHGLEMQGLESHVTSDAVAQARRRISKKIQELAQSSSSSSSS